MDTPVGDQRVGDGAAEASSRASSSSRIASFPRLTASRWSERRRSPKSSCRMSMMFAPLEPKRR